VTAGVETVLEVAGLTLSFGHVTALEDVSFEVGQRDVFAVIGPNGAGKSSLFNVLSGVYRAGAGTVRFRGHDLLGRKTRDLAGLGIARSLQNLALFSGMSAIDNVLVGRHPLMRSGVIAGSVYLGRSRREERAHRAVAHEALEFVGLQAYANRPVSSLPYSVQKRLEVARCLVMDPQLVLLDEPVAGLDVTERADMTALLHRMSRERDITLMLVEHDMGMVMQVANRVMVLDFGHVIALGEPAQIQQDEVVIRAYLGAESGSSEPPAKTAPR